MFIQTPDQVLPSNTFPVDLRNFKCIIFLLNITNIKFGHFIACIILYKLSWPFTIDIVDPDNKGIFGK